jgi:hypothetical protein
MASTWLVDWQPSCALISQRLPRDVLHLSFKTYEPFLWHQLNAKDLWILGQ